MGIPSNKTEPWGKAEWYGVIHGLVLVIFVSFLVWAGSN